MSLILAIAIWYLIKGLQLAEAPLGELPLRAIPVVE